MDIRLMVQSTPNPNALKFVLSVPVKTKGNVTYTEAGACGGNELARQILLIGNVSEVYFFDNYITVTQDGNADWDDLEEQVRKTILDHIEQHNPDFEVEEHNSQPETPATNDPELLKIEAILDQTVRPALQMDGGDIRLMGLDGNVLRVFYQGACGSCPSAAMGTLKAIENLLRDQYNPDMVVEMG